MVGVHQIIDGGLFGVPQRGRHHVQLFLGGLQFFRRHLELLVAGHIGELRLKAPDQIDFGADVFVFFFVEREDIVVGIEDVALVALLLHLGHHIAEHLLKAAALRPRCCFHRAAHAVDGAGQVAFLFQAQRVARNFGCAVVGVAAAVAAGASAHDHHYDKNPDHHQDAHADGCSSAR